MSKGTDAFDKICGNCTGIDVAEITIDDVMTQATINGASAEDTQAAIDGLVEYQARAIMDGEQ